MLPTAELNEDQTSMSLRKKIADSPTFNAWVARQFARYIRWVHRSTKWDLDGSENVQRALEEHGAVILVGWHQRLLMSPYMLDIDEHPCRSLTSGARAGRLAGVIQENFGFKTTPMVSGADGMRAMRTVLKGLRNGTSIAIAADGPQGPARVSKTTPVIWARSSKKPVFVFAYSTKRFWAWPTWDRMMFPWPFNRGHMVWRRWDVDIPGSTDSQRVQVLAQQLSAFADQVTEECDLAIGHSSAQL